MNTTNSDNIGQNIMKQLQNTLSSSSNLENQDDINQSLINAGLPMNKINELIESTKNNLLCDSNCQRDRKARELRNTIYKAEQTLEKAPGNLIDAERNFFVYTKGEKGYEEMNLNKYAKEAKSSKDEAIKKHRILMNEMREMLEVYKINTTNLGRINELMHLRLKENEELKKTIYDDTGIANTNQRRVVYEDREINWLNSVRKTLIYCCIIIFIVYLILGDFFKNKRYKSIQEWLLILTTVIYVFNVNRIAKWTFLFIYKIIYFYNYIAPKNVYTNL